MLGGVKTIQPSLSRGARILAIIEKDVTVVARAACTGAVINQLQSRPWLISHAIFIPARSEPVASTGGLLSARMISGVTRITKMPEHTTKVSFHRYRTGGSEILSLRN